MITGTEALRLPSAQLTHEETAVVDKIIRLMDCEVREGMKRGGVQLKVSETRPHLITEVALQLKRAGWNSQWEPNVKQSSVHGGKPQLVGYIVTMVPTDESFDEASKIIQ